MFARADKPAENRQPRVLCLFEIAADQSSGRSAQPQTLLIAAEQIDHPANVPTLFQLPAIIKRELIPRVSRAFCLSAEGGINGRGKRVTRAINSRLIIAGS